MRTHSVPSALVRLALTIGLVLAAALAMPAEAHAAAIPLPENDPFYAVPADIASLADGAIIGSRAVATQSFGLPLPVHAWQLEYRTTDSIGRPTATVTTVMVPVAPWLGKGPRPLVSYQTAEDGVAGKCAPSYTLRAGLRSGFNNSAAESLLMASALLNGWAVAAPDYEGPQSAFLGGLGAGRAVLDGLRAAQHFAPDGVASKTPIGAWGYSGGAYATSIAAELQPAYAPEVHFAGIALGGLVADVDATINAFSGSVLAGALPMGINGVERAFPNFDFSQYLNAHAKQLVTAAAAQCLTDASASHQFLTMAQLEAFPGAFQTQAVQQLLHDDSPLYIPGTPQAPVYDYHTIGDEFAPIAPDRAQMRRFCAAGVTVQHVEDPLGEHITGVVTAVPGVLAFLQARFAGRTPVNTCNTVPSP
ncbi:lipase family protein [Jatrophihabitans sp.]|uniref:lipase family protein n=1 Tax=Jatrophihabitans sp. TaxID=1932789 RepID=UPI0030C7717C|nr:lipase [Jatrophihabitans sp.]